MSVVLEKELPNNWVVTSLGEILTPSKEKFDPDFESNKTFIGLEHIESNTGKIIGNGSSREVRSTKSIFNDGDVLYGKLRPYLNKVAVSTFNGICSTDILVFPKNSNLESKFVAWFLSTNEFVRFANGTVSGIQHPRTSFEKIYQYSFPLPPLNEQKRIVAKIEELFSLVDSVKENLEKTKLLLKQYRQSILKHAFEGKLTEELRTENKTSNQWQILSLDQVSDVIDPHPSHRAPPEEFEGFPFVGIGDIDENGNINLKNCRKVPEKFISQQEKSYEIKDGSIGYARVGTVGKVVKLKKHNFRYSLSPTLSIINSKENIFPKFLFYQLQSNLFFQQVRTNLTGTTRDAIGITKLRKIQVYIPSLNEQKKIATKIEESFSIIEKNEKLVDSLLLQYSQIKNSILKQAFKGKLVPQDPNDEPAEILLQKIKQEKQKIIKETVKPRKKKNGK